MEEDDNKVMREKNGRIDEINIRCARRRCNVEKKRKGLYTQEETMIMQILRIQSYAGLVDNRPNISKYIVKSHRI